MQAFKSIDTYHITLVLKSYRYQFQKSTPYSLEVLTSIWFSTNTSENCTYLKKNQALGVKNTYLSIFFRYTTSKIQESKATDTSLKKSSSLKATESFL